MTDTLVTKFEKRLNEQLDNAEGATPAVLKIALQYILATKLPRDGAVVPGSGFEDKEDKDDGATP